MIRPRLHHFLVLGGAAGGIAAGTFVIDTDPQAWGVIFGTGAGVAGGAFLAAVTSGEPLAGGSSQGRARSRRRPNPALSHWEVSAPPSANGKHEESRSESQNGHHPGQQHRSHDRRQQDRDQ